MPSRVVGLAQSDFRAVAEWRSMQRAAKNLAISQPVVSKTIADLEAVLGVRLFDRTPQGVEPTPYGRALLKRSIAIFDFVVRGASIGSH